MLLVKDNNLIEEEKLERMREINVTLQSPSLQWDDLAAAFKNGVSYQSYPLSAFLIEEVFFTWAHVL